ncbi:hypothetical protein SDC9_85085 [bioreactor metagenome]|uniref:IrrE N-terminal-like domain-containing protein n=1 Tax=bioreactor metagenome TaxID=1076179 RepID=A0A644ZC48_9ZZZZ
MKKLEKLYKLANDLNISIHFFDLKHIGVLGLNVEKDNMPHMIFLDHSIKQDNRLHLEVLAHEIGHYFTTVGNFIDAKSYYSKLQNGKCENKADRWAYDYLIPEKELISILSKKNFNAYELSDSLEVGVEFLIKRLEYLALQKQTLYLGNDRYLALNNLPNLIIYEPILFNQSKEVYNEIIC